MREITSHRDDSKLNDTLKIEAHEDRDKYTISVRSHGEWHPKFTLDFQFIEPEEAGPVGVSTNAVLAVLIDQLYCRHRFDPSRTVQLAMEKLEEVLFWLNKK